MQQSLVGLMYEAGLDAGAFPVLAEGLANHFRSGGLFSQQLTHGGDVVMTSGFNPASYHDYLTHYRDHDPWLKAGMRQPVNHAVSLEGIVTQQDLSRSEAFADFFRANGNFAHCMGVALEAGSNLYTVSFQREMRDGGYSADEAEALQQLVPHFRRVFRTRELVSLQAGVIGRMAGEEETIWVVDARGTVHWRHGAAGDAGPFAGPTGQQVRKAARDAIDGTTSIATAFDQGGHAIRVSPVAGGNGVPAYALIQRVDHAGRARRQARAARESYGLTASEEALAVSLLLGRTLQEHAALRGNQTSTAQSHLKNMLSKTGTSRQAAFVLLLSRL
ncbi:hypothetical protein PQ455_00850 [Sphingomonas naphthae]|uniref:HTH luxR-type domain-containing protein n=1 Tax=Sphingomonas naphthae TaxID=1813468 RepID=A0ABY7TM90_9SPHN|nr:hypothetical protein [Sphingomonas naphthae]WCT73812.1 hypothetical protein PQ455_00850 [Sphingomonas naphthae]